MPEPRVLLNGLGIPESPRWHDGRLWFCNWIDRQVMAVDMDGEAEVMLTRDPGSHSMGYSIDWLPDGRLLTTGEVVRRQEPDGSMAVHAEQSANEIVVDARGNAYLNGADFDFVAGAPPKPGYIKLVTPGGHLRQVAGDQQPAVGQPVDGITHRVAVRVPGQHHLRLAVQADGHDLPVDPVAEPQPALVPPWRLGNSQTAQQNLRLGHGASSAQYTNDSRSDRQGAPAPFG